MNQIQKLSLVGGSCLIVGLLIGSASTNSDSPTSTPAVAIAATDVSATDDERIHLGELYQSCEDGDEVVCTQLHQACEQILVVGTANLHKLGRPYDNANLDAFDVACSEESADAVERVMARVRRESRSSGSGRDFSSQMQRDLRTSAEALELSCRNYGTNCEEARMVRRQYEEVRSGL